MIKLINEKFTYFESKKRYDLVVNDKKVVAFRYEKQDPQFGDYEVDIDVVNEELLTEEEVEEIKETIDDIG